MSSRVLIVFIILSLICSSGSFLFAENITLGSGAVLQGETIQIPPEGALYKESVSKLRNVPEDLNPKDIMKYGWKEDQELENILNDNKEAIELFKKATMQKSEGFIFAKKPVVINATSEMPKYLDALMLYRLLLLEARRYEFKNQYAQASDDYVVALRFVHHLSQQKYGIMMAAIISSISIDAIYPCLRDAINNKNFTKKDYRRILDSLLLIKGEQDFLKSALEEEKEFMQGSSRLIEEGAKKQLTFKELFGIDEEFATNEQRLKYESHKKELTGMLDSEFFAEFFKQVDDANDSFFSAATKAAECNKPEIYEQKVDAFTKNIQKEMSPLAQIVSILGTATNNKSAKLRIADIAAQQLIIVGTPSFSRLITRYHVFYNKLDILIVAFAVKLYQVDNKALPEDLNQLVPKYLEAIPLDTFNNFQPLTYTKGGSRFTVSSKGAPRFEGDENIAYDKGPIIFSSK